MDIAIAAIVGALIHRFRGGWPDKPSWMLGHARLWSALFVAIIASIVMGWHIGVALALSYLFGSVFGWHNWMNCGDPNTYKNGKNIAWIDDLLMHWFGKYWTPTGETGGVMSIPSPSGYVRPLLWRERVACVGMALRGLYYVPMLLVVPIVSGHYDSAWLALSVFLFAPIYGVSRIVFNKTKNIIHYRDDSLTIAEPVVGALFGSVIMLQYIMVN